MFSWPNEESPWRVRCGVRCSRDLKDLSRPRVSLEWTPIVFADAVVVRGAGNCAGGPWNRLLTPHPAPIRTRLRGYQVGARTAAFAEEVWTAYPAAVGQGRISREALGPWDVILSADPDPSRVPWRPGPGPTGSDGKWRKTRARKGLDPLVCTPGPGGEIRKAALGLLWSCRI